MISIELAITVLVSISIFLLGGMGVLIQIIRKSDLDKITLSLDNIVAATDILRKDVQDNYVRKDVVSGLRELINEKFNHLEKKIDKQIAER